MHSLKSVPCTSMGQSLERPLSPQSALRVCSCVQKVAGRAQGGEGACFLCDCNGARGRWKGERRDGGSGCLRVQLLCETWSFMVFLQHRMPTGEPSVGDAGVNRTTSAFKKFTVSLGGTDKYAGSTSPGCCTLCSSSGS